MLKGCQIKQKGASIYRTPLLLYVPIILNLSLFVEQKTG
jgi:hypothetical protein